MLGVATRLFADRGFKAVSIREIADKCGVTLSSLYHHFGDKRQLYVQVHLREFRKSSARLEAAVARGSSAERRLLSFTVELCRVLSEPGPLFKLVARHWLDGDAQIVRSLAQATVPAQFRAVRDAIGVLTPARNPTAAALSIYAMVHGLITLRPFEESLPWGSGISRRPEAMAEYVLQTLLPATDWKKQMQLEEAATGRSAAGRLDSGRDGGLTPQRRSSGAKASR
jgi:AcrR family transcriptional regulator